jgi:hypothetical protein
MKTVTYDETQWKLVPINPTDDMLEFGCEQYNSELDDSWHTSYWLSECECREIYEAMLLAASQPPVIEQEHAR